MDRPIALEARSVDLPTEPPFHLGRARIDPEAHEYVIDGRRTRLQPQTLKVLVALHDKRGRVVSRDELIDRCWGGRIVGDDVINRCISQLRSFAGESGGFEIETISRAGYRLVEAGIVHLPRKRRWIAVSAVTSLSAAAVAAWLATRPTPSQGLPPTPNISVMPFTADANDAVGRQVAAAAPVSVEHMMTESGFAVIRDDPPAKSNTGPSDYVLTGKVWHAATSVDATVQLISKQDGSIAYSHDFSAPIDRAADLPDRIGAAVVTELGWTGAAMILDPREHLSPQVRSELMSATTLIIEGGDSMRAYQLVRNAATLAPQAAFAQLDLAIQTRGAMESIPRGERADALALARRASARAQALAPEFGDVYLTWCLLHSPVRMTECEAHVRHALQVDSRSSFVPGYFSFLFHDAGLVDDGLQLARQSLANDPYRPAKMRQMMRMLELAGDSDEAQQVYEEATRLWPDQQMREIRFAAMAERGNYAGLAAFADPKLGGPLVDPLAFTALLTAQRRHDLAGAERACATRGLSDFTSGLCMTILADLGDRDRSFAIAKSLYPLSQAPAGADQDRYWLDQPDGFDLAFLTGPAGKSMRADPRFLPLADKLGLLAYWRSGRMPDFCTKAHEPECGRIARR